jgi:hypothetical protein
MHACRLGMAELNGAWLPLVVTAAIYCCELLVIVSVCALPAAGREGVVLICIQPGCFFTTPGRLDSRLPLPHSRCYPT